MSHTLTLPWVERATRHFVFADRMREIVSIALASGQNLILSGPGGHGKSEFLEAAFGAIKDIEPYVKQLSRDTTADELFGGIDMDALNRATGATIQFNPELSFLAREIAVLEELFDAPGKVLSALKDTLTARRLRNGAQNYDMLTTVIAAATNHSPQEIAEAGADVEALVQRFPLQLEVKWDEYDADAFLAMFETIESVASETNLVSWEDVSRLQDRTLRVSVRKPILQILSKVIEELIRYGVGISPRTGGKALELVRAAAVINDRDYAVPEDIRVMAYLPGCQDLVEKIDKLIAEYAKEFDDTNWIEIAEKRFDEIKGIVNKGVLTTNWRLLRHEVSGLQANLKNMTVDPLQRRHHDHVFGKSMWLFDALNSKINSQKNNGWVGARS